MDLSISIELVRISRTSHDANSFLILSLAVSTKSGEFHIDKDIEHLHRLGIDIDRTELEKVYYDTQNLNRYLNILKRDGPYDNSTINYAFEFWIYSDRID